MKQRCVIIGAGLGGLSSGVMLAKNGYDVTVLEQHHQIGGCLQCFTRKGTRFETGMHFIGSADKGQNLYKLLNYLDVIENINLERLDSQRYETFLFKGNKFEFASGQEAFIEKLSSYFPKEKDNLVRYCNLVSRIAHASSMHSLNLEHNDIALSTQYQLCSINEVIDGIFTDEMIKNVICGENPLFAAESGKTPFSTHAFIMNFYNQSAHRVIGGSDAIASSLKSTIESYGGKVLTNKRVTKISCDDTKATGVIVNDDEYYNADLIIANIHPSRLIELVDGHLLRSAYRNRINRLPETVGCFSVYIKFKPNSQPYYNYNIFGYNQMSPWGCENYDADTWPIGYLYMHLNEQHNQKWANSGVILSYMRYDEVEKWKGSKIGQRGADYEAFKREKAEKLIDMVTKDIPELRGNISTYYTSTPLTYVDYTGTEKGAMYGVAKDINLGVAARVQHKTKIRNLLLTGQNINSHGILGVIIGSIVTCSELLGENEILNQIRMHNE